MPGVDGLRALAVAAVVVFHLRASWLPGGFLGVDVFLVISGYLITSLLLAEYAREGRINLKRFWLRRARRLLPVLFLVMAVTLTAMLVFYPDEVARLRGAAVAALAYVSNWYFVVTDTPYFAQFGRPSVFLHLWSLSVEEQFYLAWPLLLLAGLAVASRRVVGVAVVAACVASAALGWWMYQPFAQNDRLFYGTDVRAVGLLAGVALAFALPPHRCAELGSSGRRIATLAGSAGLVALAIIMVRVNETSDVLFRGALPAVAIASLGVIAASIPGGVVRRLLSTRPMVWVGLRSYGIYLWHWPAIQLTRPQDIQMPLAVRVTLQVALTLAAAALSYRFLETPFRRRGFAWIRGAVGTPGVRGHAARAGAVGAAVGVVSLVAAIALAPPSPAGAAGLDLDAGRAALTATRGEGGQRILFLGDSVMLVAAPALRQRFAGATIDAAVGRRFAEGSRIALARLRRPPAASTLVLHLGNNYFITPAELESFLRRVPPGVHVFLTTVRVPLPWQDSVNRILRDAVARHPRVTLIDWYAASGGPGLLVDGAHTNARGSRLYASVIATALTAHQSTTTR